LEKLFIQLNKWLKRRCFIHQGVLSAIVLAPNKAIISKHMLKKDGKRIVEVIKGKKLHQVMDKFITLSSPNVQNLVGSLNIG
jgi:hypothetical protein